MPLTGNYLYSDDTLFTGIGSLSDLRRSFADHGSPLGQFVLDDGVLGRLECTPAMQKHSPWLPVAHRVASAGRGGLLGCC